jgi:hypothetical protein
MYSTHIYKYCLPVYLHNPQVPQRKRLFYILIYLCKSVFGPVPTREPHIDPQKKPTTSKAQPLGPHLRKLVSIVLKNKFIFLICFLFPQHKLAAFPSSRSRISKVYRHVLWLIAHGNLCPFLLPLPPSPPHSRSNQVKKYFFSNLHTIFYD